MEEADKQRIFQDTRLPGVQEKKVRPGTFHRAQAGASAQRNIEVERSSGRKFVSRYAATPTVDKGDKEDTFEGPLNRSGQPHRSRYEPPRAAD